MSIDDMGDENPYKSPEYCESPFPTRAGQRIEELAVPRVRRSFLYRCIQVTGRVEATIEYRGYGIGYESVSVDGAVAAYGRNNFWSLQLTPRIEFAVRYGDEIVPAAVDVRTAWVFFLRGFRLTIGGVIVYSEGTLHVHTRPRSEREL